MITFSFIIPHKNSPELLKRCIDSIPLRDDIEIIIVDDNSNQDKIPIINRENTQLIHLGSDQSRGAGHARNAGLETAKGEWILFADADDTYTEELSSSLDSIRDVKEDVVYYNYLIVSGDKMTFGMKPNIEQHQSADEIINIKYGITMPWNKIVRSSFLKKYDIKFEECPVGNDIFFTYQVAYLVQNRFIFMNAALYNYYIIPNSITHRKKNDELYYLTICKHIYQCNAFSRFIGDSKHTRTMFTKILAVLIKKGWSQFFLILRVYMTHLDEIIRDRNYYVEVVQQREKK